MRRRCLLYGLVFGALAISVARNGRAEPLGGGIGRGRYARMKMRLEKTFLGIDVLDLEVWVDEDTARRLEPIVKDKKHSKELEQRVVDVVLETTEAQASIRFLRNVTFDQFVEGGQANARRAFDAKMIGQAEYERVRDGLARWFAPLKKRGIRTDDHFQYRGDSSTLRTLMTDGKAEKVLELTQEGAKPVRTMLASYLAPGSDFRGPLVRSLFGAGGRS